MLRCGMTALVIGLVYDLLGSDPRPPGDPADAAAALNITEGHGSRNREAWVPVLLERVRCRGLIHHWRGREGDDGVVETFDSHLSREPNPL